MMIYGPVVHIFSHCCFCGKPGILFPYQGTTHKATDYEQQFSELNRSWVYFYFYSCMKLKEDCDLELLSCFKILFQIARFGAAPSVPGSFQQSALVKRSEATV